MKGKTILMAGVAAIALVGASGTVFAAASPSSGDQSYQALADRVAKLEEALEDQQDKAQTDHTRLSTLEQNFNDTSWSFDNARPTVKSGDGRFTMAFRVRFQFDDANFFQPSSVNVVTPTHNVQFKDLSNGAVVRRAFFGVEGKAFNDFWYELRYNAGGSDGGNAGVGVTATEGDGVLSLARVAYLGIPNLRINLGIIEPAFMFEGTTSSGQLMFMERPEIDNIAADSFGAGDARRGLEVVFQKQDALMPGDNLVLGAAFTGNKTGSAQGHGNFGDEQTQILGHASYRFWSDGVSNASFGADYSKILNVGGAAGVPAGTTLGIRLRDRPEIRVDGDRLIDTGTIAGHTASMYAFNAGANFDNFYLGGEWAHFNVAREATHLINGNNVPFGPTLDNRTFSGYYLEGSWVLTGEPKSYTVTATNNEVGGFGAPKVANPFSLAGDSWGAWELTARYSNTDLNWHEHFATGTAGGDERVMLVGVNWYLNQTMKLQVNDMIVNVSKLNAAAGTTQVGQNMNILGVRMQFSN
jgi:phosphate-selective porin OprO/OprP